MSFVDAAGGGDPGRMSLQDLFPALAPRRSASLRARLARLAAWAWWALRTHLAELQFLPRGSAGPPPD
jgi:hypothetical protein